jgi:hypothetical protein
VRDRRFWILTLGVFPLAYVGVAAWPLLVRSVLPPGPVFVVVVACEAAALWRCVEPNVVGDGPRARRVALGMAASVIAGAALGATVLILALMLAYGDGA